MCLPHSRKARLRAGEEPIFARAQTDLRCAITYWRMNMKKMICLSLVLLLLLTACTGNYGDMELKDAMAIPDDGIVEKALIQQIQEENAVAVFYGESNGIAYEWKLFAADISEAKDVNLLVDLQLGSEELLVTFAQEDSLGFSAMLSISLPEKWAYLSASAYQEETAVYSVSLTGTSDETTLNLYVSNPLGTLVIRPNAEQDSTLTNPTETTQAASQSADESHVHVYTETVVAPTCTENGYTVHICTCGDSYQDSETEATGHVWDEWVTTLEPTTESTGEAMRQCAVCLEVETRTLPKVDPNHTHSYSAVVTAPTCTQAGYTTYTCSCGDSYQGAYVAATGHSYTTTTIAPTESQRGYDLHICAACGASYKDNYTDPVTSETESPQTEATQGESQTSPTEPSETEAGTQTVFTCTFSIECSTILNNLDMLSAEKLELVPSDGVILAEIEVEFTDGESVFDVLQRVCQQNGIHLEASWTPLYDSAYVEGIANLYEFDCGELSGWMYRVNGWYPNYGCSSYLLEDGDVVEWRYTCDLGRDVGDTWLAGT